MSSPVGDDALALTDWAAVGHAYGRAIDTPGHLRALLAGDRTARDACMTHLWSAIIHQGTPWTATAPVACVVAGWLSAGRIGRDDPLRAHLLSFLTAVAEAAREANGAEPIDPALERRLDACLAAGEDDEIYEDVDLTNALFFRAQRHCLDAMPVVRDCFEGDFDNPSASVRANATHCAATIVGPTGAEAEASELVRRFRVMADNAADTDERCAHVLALGQLGADTSDLLSDPSPAVRMCAALAPGLAEIPAATDELVAALSRAADMDSWFVERPPQFEMRPRIAVIRELVRRVPHFDAIVDAAIAVVPLTTFFTVDFDVKPLLLKAFPAADGTVTTAAQRHFLGAMMENDLLWSPSSGNCAMMFAAAGLPFDKEACRRLCDRLSCPKSS